MVDCHIHMVLDGDYWKDAIDRHRQAPARAWIANILAHYQKEGFTYLRDGGDRWGAGAAAREMAQDFGLVYRTPLAPLCKAGHYGSFIGITYENLREYADLVRSLKKQGADFIKIMISGLMDFNRFGVLTEEPLPSKDIRELVHIAHEEGMAVMAHVNGNSPAVAAADAGLDSLEHGAYLGAEALHAMAQSGTVWVPTLSTIGNLRGKGRFCEASVEQILESALQNVTKFASMGGLLAPGSDAGAWAVPHGLHTEEILLQQALGDRTEEILKTGSLIIQQKF